MFLPGDGEPAAIEVVHGDGQNGRVGEPLADPLVFQVTDSRGRPVEGASVVFELLSAGPGADVVPQTATTDANGQTDTRLVLGTTIGPQTGQARVVVAEGVKEPKTTFTAMALSENANGIAAVSGDEQTGPAGSTLSQPLVVVVTDAFGNPISGVTITWTAEGGGSVSEAATITDAQGRASVQRTLGPTAGQQTTLATSEGLAGSPVTFVHTATAGNASVLSIVSGNDQTAAAGTRLPGDLVVRLVDAAGNGVPGAAVTWVVGTGGGSVLPENTITDEAGRTSAQWTLGPSPGENRVDAVVSGVAIVNFRATGTAGAPAALSIVIQPSSSARNGARLERQPVVQVRDAQGNPVATAGIEITAQLAGGGGELLGTRQRRTDANGRVAFTDLAIAGAEGQRTLVFTASGYAGATSNPIEVSAIPTTTTITSDVPDPSSVGATVTVGFRVTADGLIPIGNVTVSDGAQSCGGSLSGGSGSCQLTLNVSGNRTLTAIYSGSPGLSGSSDTEGHIVNAPPPQNKPPKADYHWQCEGLTCQFTDASSDPDGNQTIISWSWNFGDGSPVSGERNPSHTFPGAAKYQVTLTVTDIGGASDQFTDQVEVKAPPPNQPPHADFEVSCAELTCTFTDKSKDDDGDVAGWHWDFGDGQSSSDPNPSHSYAAAGKYSVTLTVTDDDGATGSKTRDAEPKQPAPAATATTITNDSPDPSAQGAAITVSFTVSSASGAPSGTVTVSDAGGGGCTGNAPSDSCTYTPGGTGLRAITATYQGNSSFAESTDTEDHTVEAPPPPNQSPQAQFTSGCTDLTCNFTDQSSDPDGTVVNWSWDFGDGDTSSEPSPTHAYPSDGTYDVILTVTDNDGATDSVTQPVTVIAPASE
ncbi:MAG TPA: PKD domain-containing protein [Gemmatimonadales bacterium]